MKVGILSLGCPKNLVDSEAILAEFVKKGYQISDRVADCDIALVNTCAFIEEAKKESIDAILDLIDLKKQGCIKKLIVAGCLPQRYKKILHKEFKEADVFWGVRDFKKSKAEPRFLITPPHYGYVKISEGCDNRCAYCVISKVRGPYRSRPVKAVLEEVGRLYQASGAKLAEINLISQDLTYYGSDLRKKLSLPDLLGAFCGEKFVKGTKNLKWIRLLYAHPAHFTDELIDVIRRNGRICRYIDLPVQHINDKILKAMKRRVTKKDVLSLIAELRKNIPGIAIRSSLIVGLPGEGEKEFKELLEFIKDARFQRLGIFTYSREEGTAAYNFKAQVSDNVKKARLGEAMRLQQKIAGEINASFLGRTLEVLIDEKTGEGVYIGRTYADAPEVDGQVFVKSEKPLKAGDFLDVKITDTMEYDLAGSAV